MGPALPGLPFRIAVACLYTDLISPANKLFRPCLQVQVLSPTFTSLLSSHRLASKAEVVEINAESAVTPILPLTCKACVK